MTAPLLDINTWVGAWPFRQLRDGSVSGLLKRMDKHGIERAVVGSLTGVLYRNVQPANDELAKQTRRHTDRLVPFALMNPLDPSWDDDLKRCQDLGFKGLRLVPQYHEYKLTDPAALDLIDEGADLGWCVQVPQRIEDRRTRHPWDVARDIAPAEFVEAIKSRPKVGWMLLNALGLNGSQFPAKARYVVDISRMTSVLQRNMQSFLDDAGPDRLAFGTGMNWSMPEPTLLKLELLDRPKKVKDGIAWRNAAKLLKLP